jgi:hypothetical protein
VAAIPPSRSRRSAAQPARGAATGNAVVGESRDNVTTAVRVVLSAAARG